MWGSKSKILFPHISAIVQEKYLFIGTFMFEDLMKQLELAASFISTTAAEY
jgi:hypothetical protein